MTGRISVRRERVAEMQKAGLSNAQMAQQLGVSKATITRDTHAIGSPSPNRRIASSSTWAEVDRLLSDGCSATEAGRTVGLTATAVLAHFPGRGWTPEQSNAHRRVIHGKRF